MRNVKLSAAVSFFLVISVIFSMCLPVFAQSESSEDVGGAGAAVSQKSEGSERVAVSGGQVKDGQYEIDVESDSSMFRVVKAVLTVKDSDMSAVMTLSGTGYGKLFMGTAEEAASAESSDYIPFEEDEDGAYTYEVPVEALNQEVKCAAWSTKKEQWYDRNIIFLSERIPEENILTQAAQEGSAASGFPDGTYSVGVTLSGGGGKASVKSPAELIVKDGCATVRIEWSSPNYDYMIVDGVQYTPVNEDGNSVFEIPVNVFDEEFSVIADTTAMGTPHEIEYTLKIDSSGIASEGESETAAEDEEKQDSGVDAAVIAVIAVLVLAAVAAGVLMGRRIGKKKNSR